MATPMPKAMRAAIAALAWSLVTRSCVMAAFGAPTASARASAAPAKLIRFMMFSCFYPFAATDRHRGRARSGPADTGGAVGVEEPANALFGVHRHRVAAHLHLNLDTTGRVVSKAVFPNRVDPRDIQSLVTCRAQADIASERQA